MRIDQQQQFKKGKLLEANFILIKARWMYYCAMIATGLISKFTPGINANANFSELQMIMIALPGLFFNLAMSFSFNRARNWTYKAIRRLTYAQFILEQFLVTMIIFFAGGVMSISFLYYFYSIIASAFFFSFVETLIFTSSACIFYISLLLLQYYDILPYYSRYNIAMEAILAHNPSAILTNIWAVVSSFFIVGAFSGMLSHMLLKKEKELINEKDRTNEIVRNLSDGLVFINEKDVIGLVNSKAEELLGIRKDDVLGCQVIDIKAETMPILFQVVHSESKANVVPIGRPELNYEISSYEVKNYEGKRIGEVRIIHDISREKFVDRIKSEFVTIAGHQLRTPLSAIKGAMDLLRGGDYGPVSSDQKQILNMSFEYTNNLIGIVNDLLNISSIEHGRFSYVYKKIDINFLLRDSIERFMSLMEKKNILFNLLIEENEEELEVDPYKIKLAIGGIIDNAISYSPKHSKIEISGKVSGGKAEIRISDSGIGIPAAEKDKVFTKFFRAPNSLKVKTEGNGLDLFVAKTIIENHHGRIWFESKEGFGTCFFIELPVRQLRAAGDHAPARSMAYNS